MYPGISQRFGITGSEIHVMDKNNVTQSKGCFCIIFSLLVFFCVLFILSAYTSVYALDSVKDSAGSQHRVLAETSPYTGQASGRIDTISADDIGKYNAVNGGNSNSPANSVHKDTADPVKIIIRKSSFVNTRKIFLGDIAEIDAPALVKQRLCRITIGFAPQLGRVRVIRGEYLSSRIRLNNPFLHNIHLVSFVVPDEIYVKRKCRKISDKTMKKIFISYVSKRVGGRQFKVRNFSMHGQRIYPDGKLFFCVSADDTDRSTVKGRVNIYVIVKVDNKQYGKVSLSGWVDVFENIICASGNFPRGTILSLDDLGTVRMNISKFYGGYFTDPDRLKGKSLKTGVTRGRCITSDMVEVPALVHRGDVVEMVVISGALKIVATGIAKSDGRLNDQIRVENMRSGKIVYAVVKGKSRVNVLF